VVGQHRESTKILDLSVVTHSLVGFDVKGLENESHIVVLSRS